MLASLRLSFLNVLEDNMNYICYKINRGRKVVRGIDCTKPNSNRKVDVGLRIRKKK